MSWMAAESQAANFVSSLKVTHAMTSGSNVRPLSFRHRFADDALMAGALRNREDHVSLVEGWYNCFAMFRLGSRLPRGMSGWIR